MALARLAVGCCLGAVVLAAPATGAGEAPAERVLLQTDVPPVVRRGRVLVPVRVVSQAFGAQVQWLPQAREAVVTIATARVRLRPGSATAFADGQTHTLDVPPAIEDGRLLVPLRFVAQQLGFPVTYEAATSSVLLRTARATLVLPLPSLRAGIVLLSPRPGDVISSPVRVHGQANVFEGTVSIQVRGPGGQVLGRGFGTGAMGSFGPFTVEVPFTVPPGVREGTLFLYSPGGRSEDDVLHPVSVPVRFAPTEEGKRGRHQESYACMANHPLASPGLG